MFKLLFLQNSCAHFTCQQANAQNPSSQASAVHDLRTSNVQARFGRSRGIRGQIANIHQITEKAREFQKNIYFCFIDYTKAFDCVDYDKLWKILKEMGISDYLTHLLRNLYAGHKVTVRIGHGKMGWFKTGKGV